MLRHISTIQIIQQGTILHTAAYNNNKDAHSIYSTIHLPIECMSTTRGEKFGCSYLHINYIYFIRKHVSGTLH